MRRLMFVVTSLLLIFASPILADTRTGKVGANKDAYFAFVPVADGQAVVTLTWAKSSVWGLIARLDAAR